MANHTHYNKCEYCGAKKEQKVFHKNPIWVYTCKCIEENEKNKQLKQEEDYKRKKQNEIFSIAKLPKRYANNRFENIKQFLNVIKAIEYVNNFCIDTEYCICLIGDVGTGKTVILDCICKRLIENGYTALFIDFSRLLDRIQATYSPNCSETEEDIYKWLFSFDFIAIDDLGREKYTDKRLELAFKIFNGFYNDQKNFAFSSNGEMLFKLQQIKDFGAILDRFKQSCKYKLEFKGKSLRGE